MPRHLNLKPCQNPSCGHGASFHTKQGRTTATRPCFIHGCECKNYIAPLTNEQRIINEAHMMLDRMGIPNAEHSACDDPDCNSRLTHRIKLCYSHVTTSAPYAVDKKQNEEMVNAQIDAMAVKPEDKP